jgi:hypothetical protein
VRAAAIPLLGEIAKRRDVAQVLATISVDDDRRFHRWRIGVVPQKEFFPVTPE